MFIIIWLWIWYYYWIEIPKEKQVEQQRLAQIKLDNENNKKKEIKMNIDTINKMFQAYCNIAKIKNLYLMSSSSKYYKLFMENGSDVNSQRMISPIMIAERKILGQDKLIKDISENSELYPNTISLIIDSDKSILKTLENMKNVNSYNDFKLNFADFAMGKEYFTNIPTTFTNEYITKWDDAWPLLINWETMCNNNDNISFWDDKVK